MSFMDKTFCTSPNCNNDCGRQLPPELKARNISNSWVSYAYFCGEPDKKCAHQYEQSSFLVNTCKLCGEVLND